MTRRIRHIAGRVLRRLGLLRDPISLVMGRHSYGTPRVQAYTYNRDAKVIIGSFCSIADEVVFIVGGNHRPDWVSMFPFRVVFDLPGAFEDGHPATNGDILVGHDVWIGRAATVLSGVTVGDGAVIAASAVVSKDVRPYAIVAGNPAREIARRFSDDQVAALERM